MTDAARPAHWREVLDFWFGAPDSPERGRPRKAWFEKSDAFDATVRERFLATHAAADAGALDAWRRTPHAALALVIVLDQFPRNMFRGAARAFASDAKALDVARELVDRGFDAALVPVERCFAYLPFEHAEDLAMQRRALELFARIGEDAWGATTLDYARRHHDVIARFGRYPHRNAILGRASTPAEIAFLQQPGSGF
jgi:uncharacterized protein (DUF924 family)